MLVHRWRRIAPAFGALLAMTIGAPSVAARPAGAALAPTYTWSGFDANLGNTNWSSGANWVGGVAPTAPGPVNLVFPPVPSCATVTCSESTNDLVDLTVENITIDTGTFGRRLSGNDIDLTGGIAIGGSTSAELSLSIALAAPTSSWTFDGATVSVGRQVTGPSNLTITLANDADLHVTGSPGIGTTGLAIFGADPSVAPAVNGTVSWGTRSEVGGSPLALRDVAFETEGGIIGGHFVADHADLALTVFFFRFVQANLSVMGNAVLDADTSIIETVGRIPAFPPLTPAQTILSHLEVNGSLALGSAALTIDLDNGCLPLGTELRVATALPNALTGTFTRPVPGGGRQPVPHGSIIQGTNAPACGSETTSLLRIDYDRPGGTVSATAVAAPTITVATSHSPTVPGRPVTYTATVLPAPADGAVAFAGNGTTIAGCAARPVAPSTGQARCTTSYAAPGSHVITATFNGGSFLPPVGPSPAITQVVVPPPTAVIASPSGVSTVGTPIEGTASDAGGPGLAAIVLYFQSLTGGPQGAVLTVCATCGPGQTASTWSFTPPMNSTPGIYVFVAQAFDVAGNAGPASSPVYQIIV